MQVGKVVQHREFEPLQHRDLTIQDLQDLWFLDFTTWIYYRITNNSEDFTCEKRRFKEQKLDVWPAQKRDMLWLFATVNKSTGTWYSTGESATVQHVTKFHFLGYNWDDYPSCLERLLRLCNSDVWFNPSWRLFVPEGCMSMYLYNFIHAYIYI